MGRVSGSREASVHEESQQPRLHSSPSRPCSSVISEEPTSTEASQKFGAVGASTNTLTKDARLSHSATTLPVRSSSPGSRSLSPSADARYRWKLKWVLEKD